MFLIVYLIFVVLLGVPMMIVEMGIGRYTQQDAVMSFRKLGKGRAGFIGAMGVLSSFLILSYYSVIAGWILKYIVSYATTFHAPADFAAYTATTWGAHCVASAFYGDHRLCVLQGNPGD